MNNVKCQYCSQNECVCDELDYRLQDSELVHVLDLLGDEEYSFIVEKMKNDILKDRQ